VTTERSNRTFISSVLFLDIVEYSRKPVAEQIQLKDQFNALIAEAIRDIPAADRIILDTGDGVAVNFLGDPEDALFVAMSLRDAFAPDPDAPPRFPARIGVNLGPVRLVKDLNGQPNIIGDGINVAQRVMGFAKPGQILVSRSYFEVVSHISEGYGTLFQYEGSRTDKHVREHEVYSIGYGGVPAAIRSPAERAQVSTREKEIQSATANVIAGALFSRVDPWLNNRSLAYGTATLSVGAFAAAVMLNFANEPAQSEQHLPAPLPIVRKTNTTIELTRELERLPAGKPEPADSKVPASVARTQKRITLPSEPAPEPTSLPAENEGSGVIALAITPWGEVYVDGDRVGVSPPVNEVEVATGTRRVEIRNGSFPAYTEVVEVKTDQKIRIKHKFN
jgi:hypothetical protein